jgi:hypothetical protein
LNQTSNSCPQADPAPAKNSNIASFLINVQMPLIAK